MTAVLLVGACALRGDSRGFVIMDALYLRALTGVVNDAVGLLRSRVGQLGNDFESYLGVNVDQLQDLIVRSAEELATGDESAVRFRRAWALGSDDPTCMRGSL